MRKIITILLLLPNFISAQTKEQTDSIELRTLNEVVVEGASQYTSANKITVLRLVGAMGNGTSVHLQLIFYGETGLIRFLGLTVNGMTAS